LRPRFFGGERKSGSTVGACVALRLRLAVPIAAAQEGLLLHKAENPAFGGQRTARERELSTTSNAYWRVANPTG
jgi:hypothetical protein